MTQESILHSAARKRPLEDTLDISPVPAEADGGGVFIPVEQPPLKRAKTSEDADSESSLESLDCPSAKFVSKPLGMSPQERQKELEALASAMISLRAATFLQARSIEESSAPLVAVMGQPSQFRGTVFGEVKAPCFKLCEEEKNYLEITWRGYQRKQAEITAPVISKIASDLQCPENLVKAWIANRKAEVRTTSFQSRGV